MGKRKNKKLRPHISPLIVNQSLSQLTISRGDCKFHYEYKRPENGVDDCYVYFVFYNLELIYIGKGKGDRWKHTKTLKTHNPFIRKAVKDVKSLNNNGKVDPAFYKTYVIRDGLPESTALHIEKTLIKNLKPIGNIEDNPAYNRTKNGAKRLAENISKRGDIPPSTKESDTYKKSKETLKTRKDHKRKWYEENKERLIDESLDLEHLENLLDKGIFK